MVTLEIDGAFGVGIYFNTFTLPASVPVPSLNGAPTAIIVPSLLNDTKRNLSPAA